MGELLMEQIELQEYVQDISKKYFNKPFKHTATFNRRLRTTGGRYHLNTHNLDFNPKILEAFGTETFEGIVKHELCHYHLHIEKKGYRHSDSDFRILLKQVEGLRYTPSIETKEGSTRLWVYQCRDCDTTIYRKRRFNIKKFVCSKCRGSFELQGRDEIKIEKYQ